MLARRWQSVCDQAGVQVDRQVGRPIILLGLKEMIEQVYYSRVTVTDRLDAVGM